LAPAAKKLLYNNSLLVRLPGSDPAEEFNVVENTPRRHSWAQKAHKGWWVGYPLHAFLVMNSCVAVDAFLSLPVMLFLLRKQFYSAVLAKGEG
jgi:hypothetical protein